MNITMIKNRRVFKTNMIFIILFLSLCFPFLYNSKAYGKTVAIAEILNNPNQFNQDRVEIEGEVIGELLKGDKGLWINVLSDGQSIGVFCFDKEVVGPIKYWGGYKVKGDQVRIRGVFYKNCPLHKVMDLHLDRLQIIKPGEVLKDQVSDFKIKLSIVLFVICLTMTIIYFIKLKYGK